MSDAEETRTTPPGGAGNDPVADLARAYLEDPSPERLGALMAEHAAAADRLADAFFEGPHGERAADSATASFEDPECFGPYRRLETLGRGGQAIVYLAEDTRLRRRVALKILVGRELASGPAFERFQREARTASRLSHPNICPIYDAGQHEGVPYIAMRHVEGSSLTALIDASHSPSGYKLTWPHEPSTVRDGSGRPPTARTDLEQTLEYFEIAARALHAAHEAGVVHRDIKAGNMMVTPAGEPILLDFGLAYDDDSQDPTLTRSGDVFGTPSYMSPEQLRGEKLDRRTDVYSLGIALYHALVGEVPYSGATPPELYDQISAGRLPSVTSGHTSRSRELDIVLRTAAEPDRDRRYRTAEAFAEDLRRVRCRLPIVAQAPGPMLRLKRWSQRNPVLAAAIAILTVTGAVAGYGWWEAAANNADFRRLEDRTLAAEYLSEAENDLWPPWPERTAAMEAWLRKVDDLIHRGDLHRATKSAIEGRAESVPEEGGDTERARALRDLAERYRKAADAAAEKEEGTKEHRAAEALFRRTEATLEKLEHPSFDLRSSSDRFFHGELEKMLQDIAALEAAREQMKTRLEMSRQIHALTLDAHRDAWARARNEVLDDPRMRGLDLQPQLGLVPLGIDPDSELQEFAHLRSGSIPHRDRAGKLVFEPDSAIVFVLLPPSPKLRCTHGLELDPFLLAKHEITRAQFAALLPGGSRSKFKDGMNTRRRRGAEVRFLVTPRHPMDYVTWSTASRLARHWGLVLPTDAQWEYAAKAGWTDAEEVAQHRNIANLHDLAVAEVGMRFDGQPERWNDGAVYHAPVGSRAPNRFGLFDMIGNHWEWTRDRTPNPPPKERAQPGDGLVFAIDGERDDPGLRGASYYFTSKTAASALRSPATPENAAENYGFRLARAVRR